MDVLRENIGLLQFPQDEYYYEDEDNINEGFLGFGKKKSRWQRFKDAIGRNKGKIAAGAGMIGAGALGGLIGARKGRYNMLVNMHKNNGLTDKHIRGFNPLKSYNYDVVDMEVSNDKIADKIKQDIERP